MVTKVAVPAVVEPGSTEQFLALLRQRAAEMAGGAGDELFPYERVCGVAVHNEADVVEVTVEASRETAGALVETRWVLTLPEGVILAAGDELELWVKRKVE